MKLMKYSTAKINSVHDDISSSAPPEVLSDLGAVFSEKLGDLILSSPAKSCELDTLPPFLVREFQMDLLPFLALLCNLSLQDDVLPVLHYSFFEE